MTKTLVKKLYFTIDGKFISEFARTRVIEGAWDSALKMLVDDIPGITHEQAIAILKGDADLVGSAQIGGPESTLTFKRQRKNNDVAMGMKERLDYMYDTVFRHSDVYYQPYAMVTSWGPEDIAFAKAYKGQYNVVGPSKFSIFDRDIRLCHRSLYYARDKVKDLLVYVPDSRGKYSAVLCERVGPPPIWYDVPINRAEEHLSEVLRRPKNRIEETGAFDYDDRCSNDMYHDPDEDLVLSNETNPLQAQTDELFEAAQMSPEEKAEIKRAFTQDYLDAVTNAKTTEELREIERSYEDLINGASSFNSDGWKIIDEARDKIEISREEMMSHLVLQRAELHGGLMDLPLFTKDGKKYSQKPVIKVPRNPFLLWCLRGFRFEDYDKEEPYWQNVTRSGFKMSMDDPNHTDWMLGAKIPLKETYSHSDDSLGGVVMSSAYKLRSKIVEEWTGVKFAILSKGDQSWVGGEIVHPKSNEACPPGSIAIIPHAGPEYQIAMETACRPTDDNFGRPGLVICEVGGKLAHLAIVGREMNCTVLMIPNALKKYPVGRKIYIDMEKGLITEHI